MKNKLLSSEEKEINRKVEAGIIKPVHIPRLITANDILKYQLCSAIIKYKNENQLKQSDIATTIEINKSEISKICSYQLSEFSTERLLGMIEDLIKSGASISLENLFEEVRNKVVSLDQKIKRKRKIESIHT